jgi:hypothetical protein
MRAATGFHRYNASWQGTDEFGNRVTTKAPAQNNRTRFIQSNQAAHVLAKINSEYKNRHRSVPLYLKYRAILSDRSGEGRAIP